MLAERLRERIDLRMKDNIFATVRQDNFQRPLQFPDRLEPCPDKNCDFARHVAGFISGIRKSSEIMASLEVAASNLAVNDDIVVQHADQGQRS